MKSDFPPPVTRNSSKKELWEELVCAQDEISQQQRTLNELRDRVQIAENDAALMRYQLKIIRSVLGSEFKTR